MNFFTNKQKNSFLKKSIFALVLMVIFVGMLGPKIVLGAPCTQQQLSQGWTNIPGAGPVAPSCAAPAQAGQTNTPVNDVLGGLASVASDWIVGPVFKFIGYFLQLISGGILGISGTLFDEVIQFTILEMSTSIQGEGGIGTSIDQTWGTLRDIANMFFILVLLFTAFKAMFELNTGNVSKTILNIIIVALLINFSMFFTKVVIDASNVVAIGFYNSIVNTGSTNANIPNEGQTERQEVTQKSISTGYMNLLGLQSWYDPKLLTENKLDTSDILITGIMSSVFMLIVAVVMFVTSIMFVTRWILLVLLIILSPVAFITIIIPGLKGNFDKWMQAVINQSFFAPLYFALTWVVFRIAVGYQQSAGGAIGQSWSSVGIVNPSDGPIDLILKYFLIVGFSIAALILSKEMAKKTSGFTAITGIIGSGAIGSAAWGLRNTAGRASSAALQSSTLRNAASGSGIGAVAARAVLWNANKGASGSFDIRANDVLKKVPGLGKEIDMLGKSGGKGGFNKAVEEKAEAKAKYAKAVYSQTGSETEEAKNLEAIYKEKKSADDNRIKTERKVLLEQKRKIYDGDKKARDEYMEEKTKTQNANLKTVGEAFNKSKAEADEKLNKKKAEHERIKRFGSSYDVSKSEKELQNLEKETKEQLDREQKNLTAAQQALDTEKQRIEREDSDYQSLNQRARGSKQEMDLAAQTAAKKEIDRNEYSEEVIKLEDEWKAKKDAGKNRMEAYAERIERASPVSMVAGGIVGSAVGSIFGPVGAGIGASLGAGGGSLAGSKLPKKTGWAGNLEAGKKIRAAANGKDKKDPKKLKKDINDLLGIKEDEDGEGGDKDKKEEGGENKDKKEKS